MSPEYKDYANNFSSNLSMKLFKNTSINKHAIKPDERKRPPYSLIYSQDSVELETLKAYIKTNLKTGFIWPSISPAGALILLNKKSDNSLHLCVNYWSLNNLTIKNRYFFLLISKSSNRLG